MRLNGLGLCRALYSPFCPSNRIPAVTGDSPHAGRRTISSERLHCRAAAANNTRSLFDADCLRSLLLGRGTADDANGRLAQPTRTWRGESAPQNAVPCTESNCDDAANGEEAHPAGWYFPSIAFRLAPVAHGPCLLAVRSAHGVETFVIPDAGRAPGLGRVDVLAHTHPLLWPPIQIVRRVGGSSVTR